MVLGTTRDRTPYFRQQRDAFHKGGASAMGAYRGTSIEMQDFSAKAPLTGGDSFRVNMGEGDSVLVSQYNAIMEDLDKIERKISDLSEMHKHHLLPGFDEEQDEEQAIQIQTAELTRLFQIAQAKIKKLGAAHIKDPKQLDTEGVIVKNMQSSLASRLQALSTTFRNHQKEYLGLLRGRQEKGKEFFNTDELGGSASDTAVGYDPGFTELQRRMLEDTTQRIRVRDQELEALQKNISELATIFKDLNMLVIEQGTIIDRIDYNLEQAHTFVGKAVEELREGEKKQKSARTKYCMILLCVLIIAMTLVVIIKAAV